MKLDDLDTSEGILLFTDGSAWHQDKSGGWAWLAADAFGGECHDSGAASDTTNNRMEMLAWIKGLNAIHSALGPCEIIVRSDSEYVGKGAIERTRNRKRNLDLWLQLDRAIDLHYYVEFFHVRGHTGHLYNEMVDQLASEARKNGKEVRMAPGPDTTQ